MVTTRAIPTIRSLRRYFSRWQNLLGLGIVLVYLLVAWAAPALAPADPTTDRPGFLTLPLRHAEPFPLPPSKDLPLGSIPFDQRNHLNLYYNVLWGVRSSLRFGLITALSTAVIGVLIGAASGTFGGGVNNAIMRVTDAFLAIPVLVGLVLIQQLQTYLAPPVAGAGIGVGPSTPLQGLVASADPILLALILFSWMPYARLTNAMILLVKETEFVEAARALGAGPLRIVLSHLIPNSLSPAIILAARDIGGMVLLQATFTYIGLGSSSEWGQALSLATRWIIAGGNLLQHWWVFLPVTLALVLFGIGWNLLGDGLNDLLNPRSV